LRVIEGEAETSSLKPLRIPAQPKLSIAKHHAGHDPLRENDFYQKLIADIVNGDVSVDAAVELG
jgi:hypothetical protein